MHKHHPAATRRHPRPLVSDWSRAGERAVIGGGPAGGHVVPDGSVRGPEGANYPHSQGRRSRERESRAGELAGSGLEHQGAEY